MARGVTDNGVGRHVTSIGAVTYQPDGATGASFGPAHDDDRWVRPTRWALIVVLVFVLAIVLWPSRPAAGGQTWLQEWFVRAHGSGLPTWLSFGLVEFVSNVIMFVPLGLLGTLARPPGGALTVVIGAVVLAGAVELLQQTVLPSRTGDLRDVVANTTGALIGVGVAELIRRRDRIRRA